MLAKVEDVKENEDFSNICSPGASMTGAERQLAPSPVPSSAAGGLCG